MTTEQKSVAERIRELEEECADEIEERNRSLDSRTS